MRLLALCAGVMPLFATVAQARTSDEWASAVYLIAAADADADDRDSLLPTKAGLQSPQDARTALERALKSQNRSCPTRDKGTGQRRTPLTSKSSPPTQNRAGTLEKVSGLDNAPDLLGLGDLTPWLAKKPREDRG